MTETRQRFHGELSALERDVAEMGDLAARAVAQAVGALMHRDDVIALQLPGFGCPRPDGFEATKEAYVTWLVRELDQIGAHGPIDLVGHDWGGGFVLRLVSTRADLVRSWVSDIAGMGDVDFVWHQVAKVSLSGDLTYEAAPYGVGYFVAAFG